MHQISNIKLDISASFEDRIEFTGSKLNFEDVISLYNVVIKADMSNQKEEKPNWVEVGDLAIRIINVFGGGSLGISMRMQLTEMMMGDIARVLNAESNDFNDDLLDTYDIFFSRIICVEEVSIKPEYRGQKLGLKAVDLALKRLCHSSDLATVAVEPLQFMDYYPDDYKKGFSMDEKKARLSLFNHFRKIGFKHYGSDGSYGSDLMIRVASADYCEATRIDYLEQEQAETEYAEADQNVLH